MLKQDDYVKIALQRFFERLFHKDALKENCTV
jgi:hypothetical protein